MCVREREREREIKKALAYSVLKCYTYLCNTVEYSNKSPPLRLEPQTFFILFIIFYYYY